jgi:hypothetical protein
MNIEDLDQDIIDLAEIKNDMDDAERDENNIAELIENDSEDDIDDMDR